ncbi:MAG: carbamoyltransferase HypF [Rhodospirillaceae bacterium]|nr:carbamoyltransferase HypF [Rhodospirillaceae bacterium]
MPCTPEPPEAVRRCRLRIRGQVQGVGFRPHVYALALSRGLSGWVTNDTEGVLAEVQGRAVRDFLADLVDRAPPLARIDDIRVEDRPPSAGAEDFAILDSSRAGAVATEVPPDAAVCPACLEELFDPQDRRYRYPFLTCTHCGPRFTITGQLPYDRPQTSMAGFALCAACEREYRDPADRRFHAQPIACPDCGPQLSMPVEKIVARLMAGEILAIKGLGGFHLACDARNAAAVSRLRRAKQRDGKPFAVMVAGLASVGGLAEADADEAALLTGIDRPVVLLRKAAGAAALADGIAPGLPWLGVLLPYTPLHALLFHEAAGRPNGTGWLQQPQDLVLVMTSANVGGEPLVIDGKDAARRLGGIADATVDHDRPIVVRADDGVVRRVAGRPLWIRRARGAVPRPVRLARTLPPVLALGAHFKSTVCLTRGADAFLSQHIGDLDTAESLRFFEEAVAHLRRLVGSEPVLVAHDRHPDYASTRFADGLDLPALPVQHHHAHVAAVAAEHGVAGPLLGLALDGVGLGDDGTAWGGELMEVDGAHYRRLGHLAELPLPGGDAAATQPWRMAAAVLHQLGRSGEIAPRLAAHGPAAELAELLRRGLRCPPTSSAGRLFDAAAGLLGICPVASYEAEAAMRLEGLVSVPRLQPGGWTIDDHNRLGLLPLLEALIGCDPQVGAELFHGTLIAGLVDWVGRAAEATGLTQVALGGGCLANRVLAEGLIDGLTAHGLAVLTARNVPPNDGGLALGQAWIAGLWAADNGM